jgi:arginyl-tRNA synthetase
MYYIQYAHARICSVQRGATERGLITAAADGREIARLTLAPETELLAQLDRFPEIVATAALAYEPHQLAQYLRDLAAGFHAYYNAVPFMNAEERIWCPPAWL